MGSTPPAGQGSPLFHVPPVMLTFLKTFLRGRGHRVGWGTGQMLVKPILHGKTGSWEVAEPSFMDSSQQRFSQ